VVATPVEGVIEVRGLRCEGCLVDLWVTADITQAVVTDQLESAIDIAALAATTRLAVVRRTRPSAHAITAEIERALRDHSPLISRAQVKVTLTP
jgi:dihydroneopterin aldolase